MLVNIGTNKNKQESLKWYAIAAEQGDIYAQYNLARTNALPIKWYSKIQDGIWIQDKFSLSCDIAVENIINDRTDDIHQQYLLGLNYFFNKNGIKQDVAKAAKLFEKAAMQGHTESQNNLGWCYSNGFGVEKSFKKAFYLWTLAAKQGDKDAQYNLGLCLYFGKGIEQNLKESCAWFEKAANQGHMQAQNNLGWCYEKGYGFKQNLQLAAKWYIKSANQGNIFAQYNIGRCFKNCS